MNHLAYPSRYLYPTVEKTGVAGGHLKEVGGGEGARTGKIDGSQSAVGTTSCSLLHPCATCTTVYSVVL